jgi:hypothetical protein
LAGCWGAPQKTAVASAPGQIRKKPNRFFFIAKTPAYAAPIRMPTASTMAPPSTIWNTACKNGVSM